MTPNLVPDYSNAANIMTMFAPGGSINSAVPTGHQLRPRHRPHQQSLLQARHLYGRAPRGRCPGGDALRCARRHRQPNDQRLYQHRPLITDGRIGGTVTKRRLDVYAATCQLIGCDQDDYRTFVLGQTLVGTVGVGTDYNDVYYFNGTANQRLRPA